MTRRSPHRLQVKTVTIEYDHEAERGERLDQPAIAAAHIEAWNNAKENPPDVESFSVFGLDATHHLISAETLTRGTSREAPVDARRLFRHLVAVDAVGFIITHNHPGGELVPSRDDYELTRRLFKAGQVVGVPLLDHIITTPNGKWISLRAARPDLFTN